MNKEELVQAVAKKAKLTKKDTRRYVDDFLQAMTDLLTQKGPLTLPAIGGKVHVFEYNPQQEESSVRSFTLSLQEIGAGKTADSHPVLGHLVPELRDPVSGRLNAKRVSDFLDLSLSKMAHILKRNVSTIHKTPDAADLQSGLAQFERIAVILLRLAGSAGMRLWLNAPNPDLEGLIPLTLIQEGQVEVVLNLLEDMLVGQPG